MDQPRRRNRLTITAALGLGLVSGLAAGYWSGHAAGYHDGQAAAVCSYLGRDAHPSYRALWETLVAKYEPAP